jgi:hypothetical protein
MAHASKDSKEPTWRSAVTELVGVIWEHGDVAEMEVHYLSLLFFDARVWRWASVDADCLRLHLCLC